MKPLGIIIPLAALAMIGVGVGLAVSPGAGIASIGGLVWFDLSIESFKHGRNRKHDGSDR